MTIRANFAPSYGTGVSITTAVTSGSTTIGLGNKSLMLVNTDTTNSVYVRVSQGSSTATSADLLIRPNATVLISKPQDANILSHIASAGTPVLYAIAGEGGT